MARYTISPVNVTAENFDSLLEFLFPTPEVTRSGMTITSENLINPWYEGSSIWLRTTPSRKFVGADVAYTGTWSNAPITPPPILVYETGGFVSIRGLDFGDNDGILLDNLQPGFMTASYLGSLLNSYVTLQFQSSRFYLDGMPANKAWPRFDISIHKLILYEALPLDVYVENPVNTVNSSLIFECN